MRVGGVRTMPLVLVHSETPRAAARSDAPTSAVIDPITRLRLRRQIASAKDRLAEFERELETHREKRAMSRRLAALTAIGAVATSLLVIAVSTAITPAIASALWVLPSALGGSAVSQAASALRETANIWQVRGEVEKLEAHLSQLQRQLDCGTLLKCDAASDAGLQLVEPSSSCGVVRR